MDFSVFLKFDATIFQWVEKIWLNDVHKIVTTIMGCITRLGDDGIFWIALAILLMIFKKTRKAGFTMAGALIIMMVCNNLVLKNLFARPRPYNLDWPEMPGGWKFLDVFPLEVEPETSFSFPSGHASSSLAAATALVVSQKRYLYIPGFLLALLIAFSRIYIHIHYPTDVIFGALFGIVYGVIAIFVCKWIINMINDKTKLNVFRA